MVAPIVIVVHETTLLRCWFDENGILISESKVAERSKENYDKLFVLYKELSNDGQNKLCTLGNVTKTQQMPREVRAYISEELPKYIKGMALVSDSAMGKAIANFFILLTRQKYPLRFFSDREKALKWLIKIRG
jgi:hypothetical protein